MKLIAIETATRVCGAAVVTDAGIAAEASVEERNIHAERILSLIDEALRTSGLALAGLDAIAVSTGPGSFTGLRIGVSAAKGLAYAAGKPMIAVPTLHALAYRGAEEGEGGSPFIMAALDARRDEVYCQLFARAGGDVVPIGEPRDATAAEAAELCRGKEIIAIGDGAGKIGAVLPGLRLAPEAISRCSAGSVARLAMRLFREGRIADPSAVEPEYIKEFFTRTSPHP